MKKLFLPLALLVSVSSVTSIDGPIRNARFADYVQGSQGQQIAQTQIDTMMPEAVHAVLGENFQLNTTQQEALRALLGGYAIEKSLYDAQRITEGISELLQFIHDHAGNVFNSREDRLAKLNRFETMFGQIFGNPTELIPLLIDSSDIMVAKSQFFAKMTETIATEIQSNSELLKRTIADINNLALQHKRLVSAINPELAQALSISIMSSLNALVTRAINDFSGFQQKAASRQIEATKFLNNQNLLINKTLSTEDREALNKNFTAIENNIARGFNNRDEALTFIVTQLKTLQSELQQTQQ